MKKELEKCESEKGKRNLSARVLDEVSKFSNYDYDCRTYEKQFLDLQQFSSQIFESTDHLKDLDFYKELQSESLSGFAKTYANIKYSYTSSSDGNSESLANELCIRRIGIYGKVKNICSPEQKKILDSRMRNELEFLNMNQAAQYDFEETKENVNMKVNKLNEKILVLNENIETIERRFWFDKAKYTEEFDKLHREYIEEYLNMANEGPGILMMTNHLRKKIGNLNTIEDVSNSSGKFRFERHQPIKVDDILLGIKEVREKIQDQIENVSAGFSGANLIDLVRNNPRAVSKLLMKNPKYAKKTCRLILKINENDKDNETMDNVFLWGGAILGVGLMATGVGALAGAWLLAGSAAGATAVAVGTYVTVAGMAVGVTEGAYWGARSYQNYSEMRDLQSSFIAGGGDKYNIEDSKKALEAFKEARFQSALAFGFSSVDAISALKLMKIGKLNGVSTSVSRGIDKVKSSVAFQKFTNLLTQIASSSKLSKSFSAIKNILGPKFSNFLFEISKLSSLTRNALLTKLSKLPLSAFNSSENLNSALIDSINNLLKKGIIKQDELTKLVETLNKDIGMKIELNFESNTKQFYVTSSKPNEDVDSFNLPLEIEQVTISDSERFAIISNPQLSLYFKGLSEAEKTVLAKTVKQYQLKGYDTVEINNKLKKVARECR